MADLATIIARQQAALVDMQRRVSNMVRPGKVVAVDPGQARVKVDLGDEDNPMVTPWIRWTERAGARRTWNPPSVGELMTVMSSNGEIDGTSLAVHGGFTGENAAPSGDGDATVYTVGALTITATAEGAVIEAGGTSVSITGAGFAIDGGEVTHNGKNIGHDHKHKGIVPGPANTGEPV